MIESVVQNSMLRQAIEREKVDFHIINLRDFGEGNYHQIDDKPYGGGPGMVLMAGPLFKAIEDAIEKVGGEDDLRVIFPSPQGIQWSHTVAEENNLLCIWIDLDMCGKGRRKFSIKVFKIPFPTQSYRILTSCIYIKGKRIRDLL